MLPIGGHSAATLRVAADGASRHRAMPVLPIGGHSAATLRVAADGASRHRAMPVVITGTHFRFVSFFITKGCIYDLNAFN